MRLLAGAAVVGLTAVGLQAAGAGAAPEPGPTRVDTAAPVATPELIEEAFIFGTPEAMRARLDEFVAGGITLPVITPITTPDRIGGLIEALA